MEEMDIDNSLAIKAQEFLESRKYVKNLDEILASVDDEYSGEEAIYLLKTVFMEILKRRTMMISKSSEEDTLTSDYISGLRESYEKVWTKLTSMMSNEKLGQQATSVLFTILGQEGKFPLNIPRKGVYFFPENKLSILLKKAFLAQSNIDGIHKQLDEFTNFIDVAYYVWIVSPKLLQKVSEPSEKFISRVLEVLQRIPIPSEEELNYQDNDVLLCFTKSKAKFRPKYSDLQEAIQNLWNIILSWKCTSNNHRSALVLLIENILPHLSKPILCLDYLMESLNAGGNISLLALQGIFVLVKDHNIEYPNIYGKLYTFFHPTIFYTKYKSRLYSLTNIFLSSTHLPEVLVASYIKRFARLCLQAPPHDIIVLAAFIGNLLIRHPSLKIMIQHSTGKTAAGDPFIDNEGDPFKTKAIESSLWELEILQNHVSPKVSTFVSFINRPLPTVEWDIESLIENTYEQIFDKECKKRIQKASLTFEKPVSFFLPKTDHLTAFWNFDES